jgi:hypothetical protein
MAPIAELESLRAMPLEPAGRAVANGAVLLEGRGDLKALEVEVSCTDRTTVLVDLLDESGTEVLRVAAGEDAIEIGTSALVPVGRDVVTTGPLRLFYDDGICEVFTAAGLGRTEIFYGRPPVRSVTVREQTAGGRPSKPKSATVRAWELASIW